VICFPLMRGEWKGKFWKSNSLRHRSLSKGWGIDRIGPGRGRHAVVYVHAVPPLSQIQATTEKMPEECPTEGCSITVKKGQRYKGKGGLVICCKCNVAKAKVKEATKEATWRERVASEKERGLDALLKEETQKRLQLEANIVPQSLKLESYTLEDKDATLVFRGGGGIADGSGESSGCQI